MSDHNASSRRVALVVEDEAMIAMLIEDMLDELGFDVTGPAARVDTALGMVQSGPADVAILDVNVHGAEVYPVADALRGRGVPFVFATGYGAAGVRSEYSGVPVLQKPFTMDQLQAALSVVMQTGSPA